MIQPKKYIEETRHPSSPISTTSYFSQMEVNSKDSAKVGKIIFKETPIQVSIKDPLCNLNLKETSEFVNSMPFKRSQSIDNRVLYQERRDGRLDSPATPGFRPIFRSSPGNNFNLQRKSVSSKWEDAEKWLVSSSSFKESPSHLIQSAKQPEQAKNSRKICEYAREGAKLEDFTVQNVPSMVKPLVPADVFFKDKYASDSEQFVPNPNRTYSNHTKPTLLFKNIIPRTSHGTNTRDIGTRMAPITPPTESTSPIRHNTPASKSGLIVQTNETVDIAKLKLCNEFELVAPNWNSREEEEEDVSKSLRHFEISRKSFAESRACAWEEEERSKSCMRYQREEAKIQAWVNLENAKAEAQSRKMEVKIQKMRSNLEEKLMKRMAIVHRKAEEWRVSAQTQHSQQIQRAYQNAQKMKNEKKLILHGNTAPCACFSCNNRI
ncbi:Remorin, C-terminal region [Carex littledalei]|uniref:Remorin, C-terminal region n=1 Tax=Carex littledalei TaxID=544730 RepID=A0A833QR12_9POAL|nr:Remorin, C-terminal region [Carex littledalei]